MGTESTTKLEVAEGGSSGTDVGEFTGDGERITQNDQGQEAVQFETDGTLDGAEDEGTTDAEKAGSEETPDAPDDQEQTEGAEEGEEPTAAEELPDFDPENEEVVAKYDTRFNKEDGSPNLEAWGEAFDSRADGESPGHVTESEYAYAQAAYGADKDTVDDIIAGRLALRAQKSAEFYGAVGGEQAYNDAVEWGSKNYTKAQKDRFNALREKGGEEFQEAVLALQSRYVTATGGTKPAATTQALRRPLKGVSPKRDVANAATTGAVSAASGAKPFGNAAEQRQVYREAGSDPKKLAAARARLKVTPSFD